MVEMKTIVKLDDNGFVVKRAEIPADHAVWDGYVLESGQPYPPVVVPVPESISAYQLGQYLTLAQHSAITAALNSLPADTPEQAEMKHKARMAWLKANTIRRDDPWVPMLAAAAGYKTPAEIDTAFQEASLI